MKRLCFNKSQRTKRGVASFYIVIFASVLFGVVTLSFMRIILSEAGQSSDDDLSRSAYDSAIAGVEDAKTAVNRYYSCLNGVGDASLCNDEARAKLFNSDCDNGIGIARYLYSDGYNTIESGKLHANEVLIQEGNAGTSSTDNNSDQAYTCVIVSDTVPDYRGTLSHDTPTKVIPLGISDGTNATTKIDEARYARFSWYSRLNEGDTEIKTTAKDSNGNNLNSANGATTPPTISVTLLRARSGMSMNDFMQANNTDNVTYSTFVFVPQSVSRDVVDPAQISYESIKAAGNAGKAGKNETIGINCTRAREFSCAVDFQLSGLSIAKSDSVFLIVSMPYGDTISDFSAALYNSENNIIPLTGVQIQVDSTGRTNQLVRRVETRLDPADLFFPYPQYELTLDNGDPNNNINKDFWITANCWHSHPDFMDGTAQTCENNKKIGS